MCQEFSSVLEFPLIVVFILMFFVEIFYSESGLRNFHYKDPFVYISHNKQNIRKTVYMYKEYFSQKVL